METGANDVMNSFQTVEAVPRAVTWKVNSRMMRMAQWGKRNQDTVKGEKHKERTCAHGNTLLSTFLRSTEARDLDRPVLLKVEPDVLHL